MKKLLAFVLFVFALVGGLMAWQTVNRRVVVKVDLPLAQTLEDVRATSTSIRGEALVPTTTTVAVPKRATSTMREIPRAFRLAIPFLSQAPKKNWDLPYQEACEEASAIMAEAYLRGTRENFTPDKGDEAILKFVAWQTARFGPDRVSMTTQETADAIEAYWPDLQAEIRPVKTAEDLRAALREGAPILLPANGKTLDNPNFNNGGPPYHMLVLKGYLEDGRFITNDPGTRLGENYLYTEENLMDSIHDWEGSGEARGAKRMILLRLAHDTTL